MSTQVIIDGEIYFTEPVEQAKSPTKLRTVVLDDCLYVREGSVLYLFEDRSRGCAQLIPDAYLK